MLKYFRVDLPTIAYNRESDYARERLWDSQIN